MCSEPDLSQIAALIGERSRAAMLAALLDGRARPSGELGFAAGGISAQAASMHLTKLVAGGLLSVEREGRHRYYRLASPAVADALEALAGLAPPPQRPLSSQARHLREARRCYNHLAGELGVALMQALEQRRLVHREADKRVSVTPGGRQWFSELGIDPAAIRPGRYGIARACLDWTERQHHVGGPLGVRLLERLVARRWLRRSPHSRVIHVTPAGRQWLRRELDITAS